MTVRKKISRDARRLRVQRQERAFCHGSASVTHFLAGFVGLVTSLPGRGGSMGLGGYRCSRVNFFLINLLFYSLDKQSYRNMSLQLTPSLHGWSTEHGYV